MRTGTGFAAPGQATQPIAKELRLILFDQGKNDVLVIRHTVSALSGRTKGIVHTLGRQLRQ
jgi:hypothetical protein